MLAALLLAWIPLTFAGEVRVTLFGSPCALRGPLDAAQLRRIHEISPEQILVVNSEPGPDWFKQVKASYERIQKAHALPSALDRYREKARRRLEAQWVYAREYSQWNPQAPIKPESAELKKFITAITPHLVQQGNVPKEIADYLQAGQWGAALEVYELAIEPDPEEHFHHAIGKLKVQYRCSYEPNGPETRQ